MNDKVPCSSTKLIRGGTAYSSSPFELNLQLHGQVSNPYSFSINSSVEVNSKIMQIKWSYIFNVHDFGRYLPLEFSFSFPLGYSKLIFQNSEGYYFDLTSFCVNDNINVVRVIETPRSNTKKYYDPILPSLKSFSIQINGYIYEQPIFFQSSGPVQEDFILE